MKAEDIDAVEAREYARLTGIPRLVAALRKAEAVIAAYEEDADAALAEKADAVEAESQIADGFKARAEKAEAQVAAVLAECRKVATVSGNASGYPYVLVNTIVGAIERAS